jgi:hypothetical protein
MAAMKMLIGFIVGIIICSLFMFSIRMVLPTRAETADPGELSDNSSLGLTNLIPDIERIYRQSLILPFEKAESKIYDEDIAEYYRELMRKTGLTSETSEPK